MEAKEKVKEKSTIQLSLEEKKFFWIAVIAIRWQV